MVQIYKIIKQTAGGFHSWVESSVGIIRKPNSEINLPEITPEIKKAEPKKRNWLVRLWEWVKKVVHS